MKIVYFDCFSGLSLDMVLGALLQAGVNEEHLQDELAKLNLSSYDIKFFQEQTSLSVQANRIEIIFHESQISYSLQELLLLLDSSSLSPYVKQVTSQIFLRLAMVHSKIFELPIENIDFKDISNSLLCLVGLVICIEKLAPDKIVMGTIPLGSGSTKDEQGWHPVPSPVTIELIKGIPVKIGPVEGELLTPLTAAMASVLVDNFGTPPVMVPLSVGYGKGSLNIDLPQVLRVIVGEINTSSLTQDEIATLETNIDDMNPEFYPFVMEKILSHGALDVFLTPVIMKRGRPGIKLSVLCNPADVQTFNKLILKETSSLGVRISYQTRSIAFREIVEISTPYGIIGVKVARLTPGAPILRITPEYKDCKVAALSFNVPIGHVYQISLNEAEKLINNDNV